MIALSLVQVAYAVLPTDGGGRQINFLDEKSGIQVQVPLDHHAARRLSAQLSGIEIANGMPPEAKGVNRDEAKAAARAIRGHLEILEAVLNDPSTGGRTLELEVFRRANEIETSLSRLRWAAMSGRVHRLGDRTPAG